MGILIDRDLPTGPFAYVEGAWNPEDLVDLPGSSWIIISAMRS